MSLSLGDLALSLGDARRAEGLYGSVVDGGSPSLAQSARSRLAELYELEGRMAAAAAVTEQALGGTEDLQERAVLAEALGRRLDQAGQLSAGLNALEAACNALAEAGHPLLAPCFSAAKVGSRMLARGGRSGEALAAQEVLQAQRAQRFYEGKPLRPFAANWIGPTWSGPWGNGLRLRRALTRWLQPRALATEPLERN